MQCKNMNFTPSPPQLDANMNTQRCNSLILLNWKCRSLERKLFRDTGVCLKNMLIIKK